MIFVHNMTQVHQVSKIIFLMRCLEYVQKLSLFSNIFHVSHQESFTFPQISYRIRTMADIIVTY